jgi:hypothetical protein
MKRLLVLLVATLLPGCADNYIPITGEMVGAASDTAGYIKDASVAKELAVHATLRNRDKVYRQMYPESGTKITFAFVEVSPGVHVQTIQEITARDSIAFRDSLPTQPSSHPVWGVAEKVLPSLINATVIGTLGYQAISVLGDGWKSTAPLYNGPVNSYNPTTSTTTTTVP